MKTYTPTQAGENLSQLIKQTNQSHQPIYIRGKENEEAVLLSKADYSAILETLYISSIPGLKESILEASRS